ARGTWRVFAADVRATPDAARRRFAWTLTWGLAGGVALVLALCWGARRMVEAGRLDWEAAWLRGLEGGPMSFSTALWAESPGNSVFIIPVVLLAAILCARARRPLRALAVLASFFMLDLIVLAGWTAWDRARPDVIAGGIAAPGFHAYPSGHIAQMVSAYGLFVWMWLRGSGSWGERVFGVLFWIGVTAVVALARLRLGSHWPSDIAAGAAVGLFWLGVTTTALRRGEALGGR
ncbi:MAG TPA: phosphatase PAP2 family protein, partial [Longimicrobium sp.]|nr:phosphatase PAP2 family protein [Longimicrobium sp.]